jgi:3-oxoacyl-[acyl-carrier protein] reductase
MKLLANQVALVTGGSRGIGEAICMRLAENGSNVAFTYHSSAERAAAIVAKLEALGVQAKAYKSDAASYAESETLINDVIKDFGKIDTLVNNAGITKDNLLLRMSESDFDSVIKTNLNSVYNLTKHTIRHMMKARNGSIINLSSIVGITGNPGQANYSASKAGIIGFTKSVAQELGSRNIRCNAIAPGFIETEMTHGLTEETKGKYLQNIPLGRFGKGEEVADVVVFLASHMGNYVSGQVLSVCGALNC